MQKTIGTTTYTTSYAYDASGDLTQITYPSGRVVKQSYNAIGQLCEVAPSTTGCGTAASPYATGYTYNAAGQVTAFNYGNGVAGSFNYSANRSQLAALSYTKGSTTLFSQNYYYQYDSNSCTAGTAKNNGQINCIADGVDSGRTLNYGYDTLRRLASAQTNGSAGYPQWKLTEGYDRYTNRLSQTVNIGSGPAVSLSFTTSNRPSGYTYDAAGNMIVEPLAPPNNYSFDAQNRLTGFSGNGGMATYTYDDNNQRVQKTISGGTTTAYIFFGSKVIAEYDNGAVPSSPSREYIYAGGGQLVAKIDSGGTQYYHADHLSVRLMTDASGTKIGEQGHYPFGEAWYANSTTTKWKFTSYERDSESGLDYALARFYNSRVASFCSVDPVEGQPENPQSWNRYAYVQDDPVNLTDRSGKFLDFLIPFFAWLFHALGSLGGALGHAFGILGQTQIGTVTVSIDGGGIISASDPIIVATDLTTWTEPIYATTINAAGVTGAGAVAGAAAGAAATVANPYANSPAFKGAKELAKNPDCKKWLTDLAKTVGTNLKGSALNPAESQLYEDQINSIPATLDATPTTYNMISDPIKAEGFVTDAEVNYMTTPTSINLYKGFFDQIFLGDQSQIVLHEAVHIVTWFSDRMLARAAIPGKTYADSPKGKAEASSDWHEKLQQHCH